MAPPRRPRPNNLGSHDNARCRFLHSARPSAAPIGPSDRRRPIPRLDWLSRLSFALVPAPLGGSALVDLVLTGARALCVRSGRGGIWAV